jgi:cbb3-type cytochrome oxidase subunit 1
LTWFWGIVGFLVGVVVASQLAWPELNIEPWFNFGRMRPLHTSAVIFAFGGNALIMTSSTSSSARRARGFSAAVSPGSCSGATSCSS